MRRKATPSFSELVDRVEQIERRPPAATATALHLHRQDTYKRFGKTARFTVTARLPAVTAKTAAPTLYVHTWSASYSTGGEDTPDLTTLVPGFVAAIPAPGGGYTFGWDSGSSKLVAYASAGTEVTIGTNLSLAVGTTPILVYGVQPSVVEAYEAAGDEVLLSVTAVFQKDVAVDATNYWTVEARLRAAGETNGRPLAVVPALSNAKRSFVAGQEETLYDAVTGAGTRLSSGDRVSLYLSPSSQSCLPLGDVTFVLALQRKVT